MTLSSLPKVTYLSYEIMKIIFSLFFLQSLSLTIILGCLEFIVCNIIFMRGTKINGVKRSYLEILTTVSSPWRLTLIIITLKFHNPLRILLVMKMSQGINFFYTLHTAGPVFGVSILLTLQSCFQVVLAPFSIKIHTEFHLWCT